MATKYASGKWAIAECDRCGQRYKLKELRKLTIKTKLVSIKVCPECWEPDQPQLQLGMYPVDDPQALRNPRPDVSYWQSGLTGLQIDTQGGVPYSNVLAFDMGGTTAKAGVIFEGNVLMTGGALVGGYATGLPVQMPMIDIQEVGTGGGSIARVEDGFLRVGPQSAGADPGPMCYATGGTDPTITDAIWLAVISINPGWANPGE